jgi:glucosamine-6-phosphate deaminase
MIVNSGTQPNIKIFEDSQAACKVVARHIANLVSERASTGHKAVLGLATGYTTIGVYNELIHIHKQDRRYRSALPRI